MPSKSVTLDDEQYRYILDTQDDDQSFSDRVREIVDKGVKVEREETEFACRHCGKTFGNPGAKSTHEKSCEEAPE